MEVNVNVFNLSLLSIIAITSFNPFGQAESSSTAAIDIGQVSELFSRVDSIGAIAICAAEGNCENDGTKTDLYKGHKDPGNRKHNRGFCSDQGRSNGSLENADQGCLEYLSRRVALINKNFQKAGLTLEPEAYINAVDLWNQASPRVSDVFPFKYAIATKEENKKGKEAIVWARAESFRKQDGELEAGNANIGLFGICNNPNNDYYKKLSGITPFSEEWRWKCIELDQSRRVDAIASVIHQQKK
jgi:hypothetical protein